MSKYKYYNGEISTCDGINIGWIGEDLSSSFECLVAIKTILEKHGHVLAVRSFVDGFNEVPDQPQIRETEVGIFITGKEDELNYAFFSNEMNCAKSCANKVLEVIRS